MIFTTRDMIDSKAIQSNTAEIRKENKTLLFIILALHTSDYFFSKANDFEKVETTVKELMNNK